MQKTLLILAVFTLGTTAFSQIPNYVPQNGLVGWWPFDGNANDESPNSNNGTAIGPVLTNDRFMNMNNAYLFDGINDFIELNNAFSDWQDFSFSLWVLHTKGIDFSGLISDANSQSGNDLFFNVNSNSLGLKADKSGCTLFSCMLPEVGFNNPPLLTNQNFQDNWKHIVLTKENNTLNIYLDANLIQSSNVSASNVGFHALKPVFGKLTDGDYSIQFLQGSLDDIGIWNRAMNICEIHDLYQSEQGSLNSYSTQTQTAIDSYTWPVNNITYIQSGVYVDTLQNQMGCDSIITLNLTLNFTGIDELGTNAKKLIKITDLNGKTIPRRKNTLMLFIYEDGTVERVVEMGE